MIFFFLNEKKAAANVAYQNLRLKLPPNVAAAYPVANQVMNGTINQTQILYSTYETFLFFFLECFTFDPNMRPDFEMILARYRTG